MLLNFLGVRISIIQKHNKLKAIYHDFKKNNHPLQPRKPTMRNLRWTPETPLQTMGGSSRLFSQTTGYSTPKGQVSHQKCTEENFQDHQQECNYQVVLKSSSPCSANTKVFFFQKDKKCRMLEKS